MTEVETQAQDATKACTLCKKSYPPTREFFYGHKTTKDGLYTHCKDCHREDARRRNRRYYYQVTKPKKQIADRPGWVRKGNPEDWN